MTFFFASNKKVRPQRTPAEIRFDDENREKSIVDREMAELNFNEVPSPRSSTSRTSNVIMFDAGSFGSKTSLGRIVPIPTSPQGSFIYLQTDMFVSNNFSFVIVAFITRLNCICTVECKETTKWHLY